VAAHSSASSSDICRSRAPLLQLVTR
jgi:hypothetical protein